MRRALFITMICGLAAVGSPAAAGGGGAGCYEPVTHGSTTTVTMTPGCFAPTITHIEPGDRVTFDNTSVVQHAVLGINESWGAPYKSLRSDKSVGFSFAEEGIFPYHCPFHPGMMGVVVVGDGSTMETAGVTGGDVLGAAPIAAGAEAAESPSAERDPLATAAFVWITAGLGIVAGLLIARVSRKLLRPA